MRSRAHIFLGIFAFVLLGAGVLLAVTRPGNLDDGDQQSAATTTTSTVPSTGSTTSSTAAGGETTTSSTAGGGETTTTAASGLGNGGASGGNGNPANTGGESWLGAGLELVAAALVLSRLVQKLGAQPG